MEREHSECCIEDLEHLEHLEHLECCLEGLEHLEGLGDGIFLGGAIACLR